MKCQSCHLDAVIEHRLTRAGESSMKFEPACVECDKELVRIVDRENEGLSEVTPPLVIERRAIRTEEIGSDGGDLHLRVPSCARKFSEVGREWRKDCSRA